MSRLVNIMYRKRQFDILYINLIALQKLIENFPNEIKEFEEERPKHTLSVKHAILNVRATVRVSSQMLIYFTCNPVRKCSVELSTFHFTALSCFPKNCTNLIFSSEYYYLLYDIISHYTNSCPTRQLWNCLTRRNF